MALAPGAGGAKRRDDDAALERLGHVDQPDDADARPRLSIVVLPFLNLSQDAELDYLVDGIADTC